MPTYDYKCSACGYTFEKFQSITAAPIKLCPNCKKKKLIRLIGTGAALIFKGSGFYITDYRSDSYKQKANAEAGGDAKSSDKGAAEKPAADKPASDTKPSPDKAAASGASEKSSTSDSKPAAKSDAPAAPAPKAESHTASKSAAKPRSRKS